MAGFDAESSKLRFQICDSGHGISSEEIPQLCHKFGKLFRTAEMNSEGIGLGLKISKNIIEKNGGKLYIHSDGVDLGSVFAFSM